MAHINRIKILRTSRKPVRVGKKLNIKKNEQKELF
jgi:hypothetical protein